MSTPTTPSTVAAVELIAVPFSSRLRVARTGGRRRRLVTTLTGASDPRRRALDTVGARLALTLPAASVRSAPPLPWPETPLGELIADWRVTMPGWELLGVALPRQQGRQRLSVLGWNAGNPVVVKLSGERTGIDREAAVLRALAVDPLPGIATPSVVAEGRHDSPHGEVWWLATTGVAGGRQRPSLDAPLAAFEAALRARLWWLPRPDGTPDVYVPVHGDLTP